MHIETQILKSMDLFMNLEPYELEKISELMSPMRVKEGEILTQRGNLATYFYIVLSGDYLIHFKDGRSFTLHNAGDFIGWSILMASSIYLGSSVALTDGDVLAMTAEDFMRLIQSDSTIGNKIMNALKEDKLYKFRSELRIS